MHAENLAAIHGASDFRIQSGTIEAIGEPYRILSEAERYSAKRAFGCVFEPRVNDVVLFSIDTRQQCHILSIIERPGASDAKLSFPGDVTFSTANGQLNMHANRGINMVSEQGISQVSETYTLATKRALFSVDDLTAVGSNLVAKIRQVRTIAGRIETVAGHWLQKLTNSFRQVAGVDQVKSRDAIHTVKNLYSMRSRQAVILAKKDIKVDAERIHMG